MLIHVVPWWTYHEKEEIPETKVIKVRSFTRATTWFQIPIVLERPLIHSKDKTMELNGKWNSKDYNQCP